MKLSLKQHKNVSSFSQVSGMNGLTGTNPQSLKRHQCKVSFLASDHIRSDYVLLIPVLKQFSLDFCGTKRNSTPTDCKKKYTEWYEVEAGLI